MIETRLIDRVRDIALVLPETVEDHDGSTHRFLVADTPFAAVESGDVNAVMLLTRTAENGWATLPLTEDGDWTLFEDRIARGWELTAPQGLLEAGGR